MCVGTGADRCSLFEEPLVFCLHDSCFPNPISFQQCWVTLSILLETDRYGTGTIQNCFIVRGGATSNLSMSGLWCYDHVTPCISVLWSYNQSRISAVLEPSGISPTLLLSSHAYGAGTNPGQFCICLILESARDHFVCNGTNQGRIRIVCGAGIMPGHSVYLGTVINPGPFLS